MPDKTLPSGSPLTRKRYTPAFKAECVRHVAAGAWQTDVARAQGLSPTLLGRWQHQALAEDVSSSAEREEIKCLRAELGTGARHFKKSRDQCLLMTQALPTASVMSRYQFIEQGAASASVQVLCCGLQVSAALRVELQRR